jgi:hypothetical protein
MRRSRTVLLTLVPALGLFSAGSFADQAAEDARSATRALVTAVGKQQNCFKVTALRIDDFISDAATVAKGVLSLCSTERSAVIEGMNLLLRLKGSDSQAMDRVERDMSAVIGLVLSNRATARPR